MKGADLLMETLYPVKPFVKHDMNKWEYVGRYKVKRYSKSSEIIEEYRKHRSAIKVTRIMFLIKASD